MLQIHRNLNNSNKSKIVEISFNFVSCTLFHCVYEVNDNSVLEYVGVSFCPREQFTIR